jgi:hypothetical protein
VSVDPGFEKELADLVDGSPWHMADRLLEEFPLDEYGNTVGRKSGLWAELDAYEDALRADYGIELRATTMRTYRSVAIAWTEGARAPSAPFKAHELLRGRENRVAILNKLSQRHGYVTAQMVRNWVADQKPGRHQTWEQIMERRLRRIAAEAKTPEARIALADLFDRVAAELR